MDSSTFISSETPTHHPSHSEGMTNFAPFGLLTMGGCSNLQYLDDRVKAFRLHHLGAPLETGFHRREISNDIISYFVLTGQVAWDCGKIPRRFL